jgi:oxaloacetate decarboxylase (Na+ extruding) subunit alpha
MTHIAILDTTLRDGQMSTWAMNMRTSTMLAAMEHLDRAGFSEMEFWLPAVQMAKQARELGEDPFEWLREGTAAAKQTRLRLHGGTMSVFRNVPMALRILLLEHIITAGVTSTRTSDPWNDYPSIAEEFETLHELGMDTVVNIIYSVSPRHTDEYYTTRTKEALKLNPWRLCFKDVGGLLTPERARTLIPQVLEAAGDVPVEFHSHCNSGLAPICVLEAAEAGIRIIHTAVPPLANGSSQPSVFNVVKNLATMGYETNLDLSAVRDASDVLYADARKYGFAVGEPVEYDAAQYLHQVPGGMISNLKHQLDRVGWGDRLDETLEECIRVRAEFGYPIMVTPLSQFVGVQASLNVIAGERYKLVPDSTIKYALGHWGREAVEVMDPELRARILDRPRASQLDEPVEEQPTLAQIRAQYGPGVSDEEMMLRAYAGDDVAGLIGKRSTSRVAPASTPLELLLEGLMARPKYTHLVVAKGDFSLSLERQPTDAVPA